MTDSRDNILQLANFQLAWERVAQNQGCAGVDGESIEHFGKNVGFYLPQLLKLVYSESYRPLPLRQLFIPKKPDSWRALAVPTVRDRIVQQAVAQYLVPIMDRQFEACSFAYRPGRSHLMAVQQIAYWRDRGYQWLLDGDIVSYFDNIDHDHLLAEIAERKCDPWILSMLDAWLHVGTLTVQGLVLPKKGIAQGSVISPLLANIYLDDFDEQLQAEGYKLIRYADDFVVLGRSEKQVLQAKIEISEILTGIGLQLHPVKTQITTFKKGFRFLGHIFAGDVVVPSKSPSHPKPQPIKEASTLRIAHADPSTGPTNVQLALVEALKQSNKPIPPPLFAVLGYAVRGKVSIKIASQESSWRLGMSTLYLVEQGTTLRHEQLRLIVDLPGKEDFEVPVQEVERILVYGNIQVTTQSISACLDAGIPIIFLSQTGEYKGHLSSAQSENVEIVGCQYLRRTDFNFQLKTARAIIYAKLMNSKQLLLRGNRKRALESIEHAIKDITLDIDNLDAVENLESLRGYEGIGASRYFPAFGQLIINPGFSFSSRQRRPPKDPINSLLSFGYTLLFNNVLSLILAEGLSLYIGNLHGSEHTSPHLAFDLMEEFRSAIVDSLVLTLINQQVLKPTDFTWPDEDGGIYLNNEARRVFLKAFEERLSTQTTHLDVQTPVSYRRVIELQIKRYKRSLLENIPYEAFLRVNRCWY
jgi:CRISP-associated protein Cas1